MTTRTNAPAAAVELLTSPSAHALLDETVRRVLELSTQGESVALVAPTTTLLDACRRALMASAEGGVVAGVHVLHHRSLAGELLDRAYVLGLRDVPAPRLLTEMEANALAAAAVGELPQASELRALCGERPRFLSSLRRTLAELRDAGVTPAALKRAGASDDLVRLHAAHETLMERSLHERAAGDAAARARAAADAARTLAARARLPWTRLVHHGSYELVGVQADLVRALASAIPAVVLAPSGEGPAHATSRRGLSRFPGPDAAPRALHAAHEAPTLLDTEALADEHARPGAGLRLPDRVVLDAFHVRGVRAEIELAARLCAQAHLDRGVPLEDLAVIARSLEPYAGHLESAFAEAGVPFTTSAGAPLLRDPWASAALTLMRALALELPRPLVVELLRSPWARLEDLDADAIAPDSWDEWTRAAGVVRGAEALRRDVLAWHEADLAEEARRRGVPLEEVAAKDASRRRRARIAALATIATRLEADAQSWSRCTTHAESARHLGETLARWLAPPEARASQQARDGVLAVLDELAGLDATAPPGPVTVERVLALIDDALQQGTLPMGERDGSGVRVLSAMPARAVPFAEVILIGLTQGSFPRKPRHDPFLPDEARARVREAAPALALKADQRDEERQLLALVLGSASSRLHVLWQRADDDGSLRAPSLFLREIARLTLGEPDLEALAGRRASPLLPVTSIPGHPAAAAREQAALFGRTSFRDAMLVAAERPQRRRAIEAIAARAGLLDEGLRLGLAASGRLEAFRYSEDPQERRAQELHDALLGPGVVPLPEEISASALQAFGRCSLQWLFSRDLGIEQREDEPDPLGVARDELGTAVHATLEAVNRLALERGGDPAHLASEDGLAVLRGTWSARVGELAGSRHDRAPLAWDVLSSAWLATIEAFIRHDSSRLVRERARIVAAEEDLRHDVEIEHDGRRVTLPLKGRIDRIIELPEGWQAEDYKTSPSVESHVAAAQVLKGRALQGLAYLLLLRQWAAGRRHPRAGRTAGTSAAFLPVHPAAPLRDPVLLALDAHEASWSETLVVLHDTWTAGAFAWRAGSCAWCDFRAACRQDHAPTKARMAQVAAWAPYLLTLRKSTRKGSRLLAELQAGAADGDDA